MTRFLSRILDEAECGSFNRETQRLFAYHQATKHTYQSVRAGAHFLDWANQPDPFRIYEGAPTILLPQNPEGFPATGTFAAMAGLAGDAFLGAGNESRGSGSVRLDVMWLSRLLWHSMAVSAWKKAPGSENRYSLRVNPSSGNLHPTETYCAVRGFADLDDGLYHYRADRHALELRGAGARTQEIAEALQIPHAAESSSLIVGLTSIFWREAWKYRNRAYRYCCHDLGHAMMSVLLAARALGLPGGAVTHFADARLTRVLGLAGGDEAPMMFLVFPSSTVFERSPAALGEPLPQIPNELSAEEVPYKLLLEMHRATILPDPPLPLSSVPFPASAATVSDAVARLARLREPVRDAALATVVRRRRSALDFDPHTASMDRGDLEQLLGFATGDWSADWRSNFDGGEASAVPGADFVTLYLYVHRVRDCEPGVYRWNTPEGTLQQLHRGDIERIAAFLSLEQPLAGNSCFTVSMIADLAGAAQAFGNRGYRYVYFEAGAIGQRLYLGAEALGWNATGIGAFYDDDVHRYLGFLEDRENSVSESVNAAEKSSLIMTGSPASRPAAAGPTEKTKNGPSEVANHPNTDPSTLPRQVIYHFAVGRAIFDPRLEG
jgi:SagB-type dehydrogenase family enzyme